MTERDAAAEAAAQRSEPAGEGEVVGAAGEDQTAPAASAPDDPSADNGHPSGDDGAAADRSPGDDDAQRRNGDDLVAEAADAVEADLAELARERDDYLDALRRLQADFENFKKRSIRQQTEALDRAAEGLVQKLLPVLDAVDLARQHGAGDGVEQIAAALLDVLTKEGLERVGEPGDPFDPNLHEAVAHEEGDGGDATLAEVMRAGWSWKGRLLRAAMVKVRG